MTTPGVNLNPQGEQMADESMVRTLAAQIEAIWPQEKALINFYRLPRQARVLDVGAGTGEFSARIADAFPDAQVVGVELLDASVDLARRMGGVSLGFASTEALPRRAISGGAVSTACRVFG